MPNNKDPRQERRDKLMGKKPVKKSGTSMPGTPTEPLDGAMMQAMATPQRPNPMAPQGPNNQDLNTKNFLEQPKGQVRIDGGPPESMFGDYQFQKEQMEGRTGGYVSAMIPPSGRRPENTGYRGQNMALENQQPTDAQAYGQLETTYQATQALTRGQKLTMGADGLPPFTSTPMGMGSPGNMLPIAGNLPEPPPRMMEELGMMGQPSADLNTNVPSTPSKGMNMGGPNNSGRNQKKS